MFFCLIDFLGFIFSLVNNLGLAMQMWGIYSPLSSDALVKMHYWKALAEYTCLCHCWCCEDSMTLGLNWLCLCLSLFQQAMPSCSWSDRADRETICWRVSVEPFTTWSLLIFCFSFYREVFGKWGGRRSRSHGSWMRGTDRSVSLSYYSVSYIRTI